MARPAVSGADDARRDVIVVASVQSLRRPSTTTVVGLVMMS